MSSLQKKHVQFHSGPIGKIWWQKGISVAFLNKYWAIFYRSVFIDMGRFRGKRLIYHSSTIDDACEWSTFSIRMFLLV